MQIAALEALLVKLKIYLSQKAQIAPLQLDKAFTKILSKYANYVNIFLFNLVMELLKNTNINKHAIKLKKKK